MRTLDDGKSIFAQLRAAVSGGNKETATALIEQAEASSGKDAVHIHLDDTSGGARRTSDEGGAASQMEGLEKRMDSFEERIGKVHDSIEEMRKEMKGDKKGKGKDEEDPDEKKDKTDDNTAIEGSLQMEAPPGTNDRAGKAKDSEFLADAYQDTVAIAEILAPGMSVPQFDRNASPKKTLDAISNVRSTALELAYQQATTRGMIDQILGGRRLDVAKMTHDSLRTMFKSVGAMAKAANNGGNNNARHQGGNRDDGKKGIRSLADLNRANTEFYARKVG